MDNNQQRLLGIKAAFVVMTNGPGWTYFKQMSDNVVTRAINEALAGKTTEERETAILKASALKQGFIDLFQAVEQTMDIEALDQQQDDLSGLSVWEMNQG